MHVMVSRFLSTRLGRLVVQFGQFGVIGVIGLAVDMAVIWVCVRQLALNPFLSKIISYLFAATTTWALNRTFTFRHASRRGAIRQWAAFLAANAIGGLVNYGTFAVLVATTMFFSDYPEAATAAGSLAGMLLNFAASKKYVFKTTP